MRNINSTSRGECLDPKKKGATHYHAQLGLPDKGRVSKKLVVCWSMARINDLWDGSLDKRSLVPCCGQDGNRAQVPQHPIDSYNI